MTKSKPLDVRTEAPTEDERELLHHLLDKEVDDGDGATGTEHREG